MNMRPRSFALCGMALCLSFFCVAACKKKDARSTSLKGADCCAAYQRSDSLPDQPPPGVTRLAIGGDSRDDHAGVVPWAFQEAGKRGAKAFFFLGDLELTPSDDDLFLRKLPNLGNVLFYPVMGNHEVETLGFVRMPASESRERVKEFKDKFVKAHGVNLANIGDAVAYSADLEGGIHLIALDNVSRKGEGFGSEQLKWLAADLDAANATGKIIFVGMHKGLAKNPVTTHAMDEDGPTATCTRLITRRESRCGSPEGSERRWSKALPKPTAAFIIFFSSTSPARGAMLLSWYKWSSSRVCPQGTTGTNRRKLSRPARWRNTSISERQISLRVPR
jgi:hypothetical protein